MRLSQVDWINSMHFHGSRNVLIYSFGFRAPLRIGFVFTVNPSKEAIGMSDGGVALLNAFNFIAQDKRPFEGLAFITEVCARNFHNKSRDYLNNAYVPTQIASPIHIYPRDICVEKFVSNLLRCIMYTCVLS